MHVYHCISMGILHIRYIIHNTCTLSLSLSSVIGAVKQHWEALVLLCFNSADQLSYEEICEATQIPDMELQLTLQSLSLHKTVKLLLQLSCR